MSTYVIGDVQGCFQELQDLLNKINFDTGKDKLWFTGDLVNRGPDSLSTLRLAKQLKAITVLGNHECHLLAIAYGVTKAGKKDTLDGILSAPDKKELIEWVRNLPFLYHDRKSEFVLVHAGLSPQWNLATATSLSREVESVLQSDRAHDFLDHMYGNLPDIWDESLRGWGRLRFIVNAFTRMRYCTAKGRMNFKNKGPPGTQPKKFRPWYELEKRKTRKSRIVFGHWASLHADNRNDFHPYRVFPLDTGCVWGRKLTAMRLEDGSLIDVPSRQKPSND